jgi:hypothetical protein
MMLQHGKRMISIRVDIIDAACYETGCPPFKEHLWEKHTMDPIFLIKAFVLSAGGVAPAVPGIRGQYMSIEMKLCASPNTFLFGFPLSSTRIFIR